MAQVAQMQKQDLEINIRMDKLTIWQQLNRPAVASIMCQNEEDSLDQVQLDTPFGLARQLLPYQEEGIHLYPTQQYL